MKRLWVTMFMTAALGLGFARTGSAGVQLEQIQDQLIVEFHDAVTASRRQAVFGAYGLRVVSEIPEVNLVLVESKPGAGASTLQALGSRPEVASTAHNLRGKWIDMEPVSFQAMPLPTVTTVIEGLGKFALPERRAAAADSEVPWGVARVNAPAAWASNQGDSVKVAIIDTGIDPNVPDLKGKVAGGATFVDSNGSWVDDHFHGTHVAGSVAAALDDKGVVGVAPKAVLYAVKVLTKEGSGDLFGIARGIMWTAQNGMQVANMSLGAAQEIPYLDKVIDYAISAGVTFVAAAGNDGGAVGYPAAYPNTIAVSALCPPGVANTKLCPTAQEGIATFSSRGPQIDFIAPGVLIPSTVPLSHDASGVKAYSGTSMACPHVSGLAALAIAKGAQGPAAVKAALVGAASKLQGLSANEQGNGLVDAAKFAR